MTSVMLGSGNQTFLAVSTLPVATKNRQLNWEI